MGSIITWLTQRLLIYVPIQLFKPRSSTYFTEPFPNKQYCLIANSGKKNYLQINAFLASSGGEEKNLEILQMKAITSFDDGEIGKTFSSINKSLGGSHRAKQ